MFDTSEIAINRNSISVLNKTKVESKETFLKTTSIERFIITSYQESGFNFVSSKGVEEASFNKKLKLFQSHKYYESINPVSMNLVVDGNDFKMSLKVEKGLHAVTFKVVGDNNIHDKATFYMEDMLQYWHKMETSYMLMYPHFIKDINELVTRVLFRHLYCELSLASQRISINVSSIDQSFMKTSDDFVVPVKNKGFAFVECHFMHMFLIRVHFGNDGKNLAIANIVYNAGDFLRYIRVKQTGDLQFFHLNANKESQMEFSTLCGSTVEYVMDLLGEEGLSDKIDDKLRFVSDNRLSFWHLISRIGVFSIIIISKFEAEKCAIKLAIVLLSNKLDAPVRLRDRIFSKESLERVFGSDLVKIFHQLEREYFLAIVYVLIQAISLDENEYVAKKQKAKNLILKQPKYSWKFSYVVSHFLIRKNIE